LPARVAVLRRERGWSRADLAARAFGSDILGGFGVFGPMFWRTVELDGDGRQELICAGANNNSTYSSGAVFILDRDHCWGAAVDPHNGGNLEIGDGSRCRIILPSLAAEVLARLGVARIVADGVMVSRDREGATKLIVRVGYDRWAVHLQCDADLHPLAVLPTDGIRICMAQWSITDAADYGFNSDQRREQWRQRIIHFDGGRTALAAIPTR
jgi:hypothetical protein